jgi:glutamate/tyrosine decarboxylase-like PLP-dependent enzyme
MYNQLQTDWENQDELLQTAVSASSQFLTMISERPVAPKPACVALKDLPEAGLGAADALHLFRAEYEAGMSASAGPRYFGFVTGGATPASLIGDWLTAVYDQNPTADYDSIAPHVEQEALHFLRQLLHIPNTFSGSFVSGATMSNFAALAQARQWIGQQQGINVAEDGLMALPPIPVLSATPHASSYKSLAMLGLGRQAICTVPTLPNREAVDVDALAKLLQTIRQPAIIIASGGTVNTVDFDNFRAIGALKEQHNFWLHVDAAFGGFAAASPQYAHLMHGIEFADSITIDAHKWLNVPYDSAMIFTRHPELQTAVFQNAAVYLGGVGDNPAPVHLAPQNSRRFRGLAAWMSLMAYGRSGYQEIIERNIAQAQWLGAQIAQSDQFHLLDDPVRLNVVCFTLAGSPTMTEIKDYLARLQADGRIFLTPTNYQNTPAIRAAISNWQTTQADMEIAWQALKDLA